MRVSEASSNHLRVEIRTERAGPADELGRAADLENGLEPDAYGPGLEAVHIQYANDRSLPTGSIRAVRLDLRGRLLILIPVRGTLIKR